METIPDPVTNEPIPDPDFRPLITEGGALTLPDPGGQCEMKTYYVSTGTDGELVYAGDPDFDCDLIADDVFHKNVPVLNEACLYNLWMCACWAN
jgi:hypothetical protein